MGDGEEESLAKISTDRARSSACTANRSIGMTTISMWRMSNPSEPLTIENLRKSNSSFPSCPEGGMYEIGSDGNIYCTKHAPRPENVPLAGAQ